MKMLNKTKIKMALMCALQSSWRTHWYKIIESHTQTQSAKQKKKLFNLNCIGRWRGTRRKEAEKEEKKKPVQT